MRRMADRLDKLLSIARATWAGMSADEREAMLQVQRESWVRGEIAMGTDKDEATERRAARTRLESDALASVALDAGDTRIEPDYKAAVRDLAEALQAKNIMSQRTKPRKLEAALSWRENDELAQRLTDEALERHAAAIAAAKEDR